MSVQVYNEENKVLYRVRVVKKSKSIPGLQVDLKLDKIASEVEANKIHKKFIAEAVKQLLERELRGNSWEVLIEQWGEALKTGYGIDRQVNPATAHDYVSALKLYTSEWMKKSVVEITRADVLKVVEVMNELGKSNSRKRCVKDAINGLFRWGLNNRVIKGVTSSPAVGIKISRLEERRPEILTLSQLRQLLETAKKLDHPWYPVWSVALLTGMRSGELQELKWSDVDFENNRLTVQRSYNARLKIVKSTKAGYYRDIPLSSDLKKVLEELKKNSGDAEYVLPRFPEWKKGNAAAVLRKFCLGAGLPSVKFHTLRACFATQLIQYGIAPIIVMKICGWKDLKTMQRYVRLAGIEIEKATESLKLLPDLEVMAQIGSLLNS